MSNLQYYISNGAVDIVAAVGAILLLVQMTKPIVEAIGDRLAGAGWEKTSVHDSVIELWALALSLAATGLLWNAGPGFHNSLDYGVWFLNTLVAVASAFGLYAKLHPFPATPTNQYIQKLQQHLEMQARIAAAQAAADVAAITPGAPRQA